MRETVTAKHKAVYSRLLETLESLIERIVNKFEDSPETIAHINEVVIDNLNFIAPAASLIKSEQHMNTDESAKIE